MSRRETEAELVAWLHRAQSLCEFCSGVTLNNVSAHHSHCACPALRQAAQRETDKLKTSFNTQSCAPGVAPGPVHCLSLLPLSQRTGAVGGHAVPRRVVPAETTTTDKHHVPFVDLPHLHMGTLLLGVLLWDVSVVPA